MELLKFIRAATVNSWSKLYIKKNNKTKQLKYSIFTKNKCRDSKAYQRILRRRMDRQPAEERAPLGIELGKREETRVLGVFTISHKIEAIYLGFYLLQHDLSQS